MTEKGIRRNQSIAVAALLLALLATIFVVMLPLPAGWTLPAFEFYIPLAAGTIMAVLHLGAAVLFLANVNVYAAKPRRAYSAIAIGVVLLGLATLQLAIVVALDAWNTPYVLGGGAIIPFFIATITLYLAVRYLARLIGMKKYILARIWIVLPFVVAIIALTVILPHAPTIVSEVSFDIVTAFNAWAAALLLVTGCLAIAVKRHAGSYYSRSMTWLARALFIGALAMTVQVLYTLTGVAYENPLLRVVNILAVVSGVLWLRAGYAFALASDYKEDVPLITSLFAQSDIAAAAHPRTVVDMVTYTAGLVSMSNAVDPLLDDVRAITSRLKPGQTPSIDETKQLLDTYLEIEDYLATKESVRRFNAKELRGQFDPALRKLISMHEEHRKGSVVL